MTRICVLGNSHVASVKLGMEGLALGVPSTEPPEVTVLGAPADMTKSCVVRNGVLTTDDPRTQKSFAWTSGIGHSVRLQDFDCLFVLAGSSVFAPDTFWSPSVPPALFDVPFVSSAVAARVFEALYSDWGVALARRIAEARVLQVVHVGSPFVSEAAPFSRTVVAALDAASAEAVGRLDRLKSRLHQKAAEVGSDHLTFMPPPPATLETHGVYTRHQYCRGSRKLSPDLETRHLEHDYVHMNGDYGRALIEACKRFAEGSGTGQPLQGTGPLP